MDYGQTMHSWMICEDTYASKFQEHLFVQNRPDSAAASSREVTRQDSADVFAGISTCHARRFYAATVFEGLGSWNANLGRQFPALGASGHLFLQSWYGISTGLSK